MRMNIWGIDLPISSAQALEAVIVYGTFDFLRNLQSSIYTSTVHAESIGGKIRKETTPTLGRIVTPIHILASLIPPVVYMVTVGFNSFQQPRWMSSFAFPDAIAGVQFPLERKAALRIGASVVLLLMKHMVDSVFYHLGEQWHYIGRRERPRIVQTGIYALVRHPLYTIVLLQEVLSSVMFWSYIPLVSFAITLVAFVVKIPIEEDLIQQDEGVREEYREYKGKVPARLVPHVW